MKAHLIDTHPFEPKSRSYAKVEVKHQGRISQNMAVSEALVIRKKILFTILTLFETSPGFDVSAVQVF